MLAIKVNRQSAVCMVRLSSDHNAAQSVWERRETRRRYDDAQLHPNRRILGGAPYLCLVLPCSSNFNLGASPLPVQEIKLVRNSLGTEASTRLAVDQESSYARLRRHHILQQRQIP